MSKKQIIHYSLGGLYISKEHLSKVDLQIVKDNLKVREYDYMSQSYNTLYYFFDLDKYLVVPKFYNTVAKEPVIEHENFVTVTEEPININMIKFPNPRDPEQQKAVDFIKQSDFGVIKAYTGFGKTWCSIRAICDLKQKTVIIVDKSKLANQWKDEFLKYTDLKEEDIGFIRGRDSFKKALQKDIIIATVQTLSSVIEDKYSIKENEYLKMFYDAKIGLIILDEVHKTSTTPYFSKASLFFMSKKIFGLSATPKKSNKAATRILMMYFGNRIFIPDDSNKVKPTVTFIVYDSNIPLKTRRWIQYGGRINYVRYRQTLLKQPNYQNIMNFITDYVTSLDDTTGTLVTAHEIKHLETLKENFKGEKPFIESGIIHSNTGDEEKIHKLIYATYGSVTAGLSINHLNKLIKSTPISSTGNNLEQLSGRVTRDHTNKDSNPEIFDLVDTSFDKIENMAVGRYFGYQKLGIKIKDILYYRDGELFDSGPGKDSFLKKIQEKYNKDFHV